MSVFARYGSRLSRAAGVVRHGPRCSRSLFFPIHFLAATLVLCLGLWMSRGADTNESQAAPPNGSATPVNPQSPAASQLIDTNLTQLLSACSQIQEQLRTTQLAIEQNRQETRAAASQSSEALAKGLQLLQQSVSDQRARDFEVMQRSNRFTLSVAGTFAALGLLAMLSMSYFQWRATKGLAQVSNALPATLAFDGGPPLGALGPAEQVQLRLLGAIEQVDKRIDEMKLALSHGGNGGPAKELSHDSASASSDSARIQDRAGIPALLDQASSRMNLDPEGALACFDQILTFDPNHAEALVKKGAALERLHKLNEAIECYDRAIAVDGSMTLAYLHKGGLYNRLERFKEALECYGKALQTHNQRGN